MPTLTTESSQGRRLVKVMVMEATRYSHGMFREASERLISAVPKYDGDGDRSWQLSDNLEDDLRLVLFPSVYEDANRLAAAHAAFRGATGAPVKEYMQTWDMTPSPLAQRRSVAGLSIAEDSNPVAEGDGR